MSKPAVRLFSPSNMSYDTLRSISSEHFTWTGNHGVIEKSVFDRIMTVRSIWSEPWGGRFGDGDWPGRDMGIEIISTKTGAAKVFIFLNFTEDRKAPMRDREILSWTYVSYCGKFKVTLLND